MLLDLPPIRGYVFSWHRLAMDERADAPQNASAPAATHRAGTNDEAMLRKKRKQVIPDFYRQLPPSNTAQSQQILIFILTLSR